MKISITFSLTSRKGADIDVPIRMRVSYDGMRLDMSTGFVCPAYAWDSQTNRMRPGAINRYRERAEAVNGKLDIMERQMESILQEYDLHNEIPEPNVLKLDFKETCKFKLDSKETELLTLYDRFMQETCKEKGWLMATLRNYQSLRLRLQDPPISNVQISRFGQKEMNIILDRFIDSGSLNTSTSRMIGNLNVFLNWCIEQGLYQGRTFKPKLKGSGADNTICYLEWPEVLKMKDIVLLDKGEISTRDSFCFQCFTGLRVSDVSRLKWSQVFLDAKVPYILVTTLKTDDTVRIELNNHAIDILNRYKDNMFRFDTVFPRLSNNSKNRNLTKIALRIGLEGTINQVSYSGTKRIETTVKRSEAITTHWGRHTFIVHALSIGISPIVVMAWTGHSDYDAMQPYIAIVDSVRADSMRKFNE